jgi:AraC-like DNA-binding protein
MVVSYPFHDFINLVESNLLWLFISFEVGFTTLSSFSCFFSNAIGVSPRQYRNNVARGIQEI